MEMLPRNIIKKIKQTNIATHRDLGYFFSAMIIMYCISGLALNHINEWNPDFVIEKKTIHVTDNLNAQTLTKEKVEEYAKGVGEAKYKLFDFPTNDQVKIYFDNASLHINFSTHEGVYERIIRRPIFYQVNFLHRNSVKSWRWVADFFAIMLIVVNVTGLFLLKGENGISGRGKWLIAAGFAVPFGVLVLQGI